MTNATKIEWTDTTWNPTVGCSRVSEGCRNCYAERIAGRLAAIADAAVEKGQPPGAKTHAYTRVVKYREGYALQQWNGKVVTVESALKEPLGWRKPRRVFVDSMSDLFHEAVPFEFQVKVFQVTQCAQQHQYQILTKRPHIMAERMPKIIEALDRLCGWSEDVPYPPLNGKAPDNVWLGTSVEDQATADERIPHLLRCPADERIPHLLRCPAAVRFVSAEPLLGPIGFRWSPYAHKATGESYRAYLERTGHVEQYEALKMMDWIIVGGESGPDARPMHPDWVRSIRDQCVAASVPFFFKQWGAWANGSQAGRLNRTILLDGRMCDLPSDLGFARGDAHEWNALRPTMMSRVGKRAAGRVLDGRTWDEMPEVQ